MSLPLFACYECGSSKNLVTCVDCGKSVCPGHRFELGELAAGYRCTSGCCVPAFDMYTTVVTLKRPERRLKDWQYMMLVGVLSTLLCVMLFLLWRST